MFGAIFDMDGVLFPTEGLKFKAYKKVFWDEFGVKLKDTPERLGLAEAKAVELFLKLRDLDHLSPDIGVLIHKKREAYYRIVSEENFQPYAGAENFLKQLKQSGQFKLGLATSSDQKSANILLERFAFKMYFDNVLSVEDVKNPKPHPEVYLMSAKRLGMALRFCVVLEDSLVGIRAAKAAGMKCVAVANTTRKGSLKEADLVTESFKSLTLKTVTNLLSQ